MKYLVRGMSFSWGGIFGDMTTTVFVYNTGRERGFFFWFFRKIRKTLGMLEWFIGIKGSLYLASM